MKVLLLGAGYATRLYPLTRERPKPLLPIGGIPILQRICEQVLAVPGVDRILIVSNHRFAGHYYSWLRDYQERRKLPAPIEIFDDLTTSNEDRLGAIGDIDFVIRHGRLAEDLLVIAGDNLFEFPLSDFAAFARKKGAAVCVKDVESREKASIYGVVEVDAQGKVVDFEEKPPVARSTLVAVGVYFFGKDRLSLFSQYLEEGNRKDAPGYFLQWAHSRVDLFAFRLKGFWYDIGDIDSYNKANEMFLQ